MNDEQRQTVEDVRKALSGECPECGGEGTHVRTGSAHDPGCDGSCVNCPVPVPIYEQCDWEIQQAPISVGDARTLLALVDAQETKALRFDLDQAGIQNRERESIELVELRAERDRLKALVEQAYNGGYIDGNEAAFRSAHGIAGGVPIDDGWLAFAQREGL